VKSAAAALSSPVQIGTASLPISGKLSLAIYKKDPSAAAGLTDQIVRTLAETAPVNAGSFPIMWDGLDDFQNVLPAGQYYWRGVISNASLVDDGQVGQGATPGYGSTVFGSNQANVAVDPAGNVYEVSPWDEVHQELRSWSSTGARLWGGGFSGGGAALAADETYLYVARNLNGENGIIRVPTNRPTDTPLSDVAWSGQPATGHIVANQDTGYGVFGLAVDSSVLWVSNYKKNRIQRYDKATGSFLSEFTISQPHGIAADGSGNVWVTHGTSGVTLYSSAGAALAFVAGLSKPFAAAIGGPSAHLYIGEAGSGKVKEYIPTGGGSFVRELFGAATPGPVRDDRLRWPDTVSIDCTGACANTPGGGLAVDSTGRIIVADWGNSRVQVYHPDGTLERSRFNGYANAPQVDPNVDPNLVLSGAYEYALDPQWTGTTNHGAWKLQNNWRPSGPAGTTAFSNATLHRKLSNGREYIYSFVGASVYVYLIAADKQSSRLSAIIGNAAAGLINAVNSNENGEIAGSEITPKTGSVAYSTYAPGLWIDGSGNFVIANSYNQLLKLPLKGFDAVQNPLYDWDDITQHAGTPAAPADTSFWQFNPTNVRVASSGEVYRVGTTTQGKGNGTFWSGGSTVERLTTTGFRQLFWMNPVVPDTTLHFDLGTLGAVAPDTDGNYFYTVMSGSSSVGGQVWVRMHTLDGLVLASGGVGSLGGGETGWVDGSFGMTAFTHNGVHYVYTEDSYYGRAVRFRLDNVGTRQDLGASPGGTAFNWNPPGGPTQVVTVTTTVPDTVERASGSPGEFTFTRTDSRGDLPVSITTSGSATAGVDYDAFAATVVIPNGAFSVTLPVVPHVDTVSEGPETVTVTIASGSNYGTGTPASATVTVHDQSIMTVSATPSVISTTGPNATYSVARTSADLGLSASYRLGPPLVSIVGSSSSSYWMWAAQVRDSTASYDGKTNSFWLSAGHSDQPGQNDETPSITYQLGAVHNLGFVRVSNFNGGETGYGAKSVDIYVSADGTTFSLLKNTQFQVGLATGAQWQEIDLEGNPAKAVRFDIKSNWHNHQFYANAASEGPFANASITGLSEIEFYEVGATPSDIQPIAGNTVVGHFTSGNLAFAAGQSTATVTVTPRNLPLVNQPHKGLQFRLLDTGTFTLGTPSAATVTLVNTHTGPVVSLTAPTPQAARGGAPGVFRFSRTGSTANALTVKYSTATVPLAIASSGVSSSLWFAPAAQAYDGRTDTSWMSTGWSDNTGTDDTPFISFSFDHAYPVGRLRVSNCNNPEHGYAMKNVQVSVSTDGVTFNTLPNNPILFQQGVTDPAQAVWQDIDLGNVSAKVVKLSVLENWFGKVFYHGTSYEGAWANGSVTGLSEVQAFTGSTAPASDFAPGTITGSAVFPAGQSTVDVPIAALATSAVGGTLTFTLTSDNSVYSLATAKQATVTIVECAGGCPEGHACATSNDCELGSCLGGICSSPPISPLKALPDNGAIHLTWNGPSNGPFQYRVFRSIASGAETLYADNLLTPAFDDTNVTVGYRYYYKVAAVYNGVEGTKSNEASETPLFAMASFIDTDTISKGNWRTNNVWYGPYGAQGYWIMGDVNNFPSWAPISSNGILQGVAPAGTTDVRALLLPGTGTGRELLQMYNYSNSSTNYTPVDVDLSLNDNNIHQVAVYICDFNNYNYGQIVQVLNATTGAVLDTQTVSTFTGGKYLIWTLRGHVKLRFVPQGGWNSSVSAIFLDIGNWS